MGKGRGRGSSRRGRKPADATRDNTLLILGGVVAALAILALVLTTRGHGTAGLPRTPAAMRITPTLSAGHLAFEIRNAGKNAAHAIHSACIVANGTAWPVLTLHPPASGQTLAGENLMPGQSLLIELSGCMNGANAGDYPGFAYFFVRYFTRPNEEHVEETLIELAASAQHQNGYRSIDPSGPSATYRQPLLMHLRRYAPPP